MSNLAYKIYFFFVRRHSKIGGAHAGAAPPFFSCSPKTDGGGGTESAPSRARVNFESLTFCDVTDVPGSL